MKVFIIGGAAKSGKNTFGEYLMEELKHYGYKPCVMRLTEPLYSYARNYFSWDEKSDDKPREFLQKMGIEVIKEKLHKPYFLINRTCEDIEILSNFFDAFIITDARLIMEFEEFRKRFDNVVIIKINRTNYDNGLTEEEQKHITETELFDYKKYDYEIENTGLAEMKKQAGSIIKLEEGKSYE